MIVSIVGFFCFIWGRNVERRSGVCCIDTFPWRAFLVSGIVYEWDEYIYISKFFTMSAIASWVDPSFSGLFCLIVFQLSVATPQKRRRGEEWGEWKA